MFDFIWKSKPAKIQRDVLTMDYEKMGLKNDRSRNIYKILKICWIKRTIESEDDGLFKDLYLNKFNQF